MLHANDRVNRLWSFFGPMVTLLTDAGLLVVWVCGCLAGLSHHDLTSATLTCFLAYISRFYMRLDSMSRMVSATQRAAAARAAGLRNPGPRAQRRRAGPPGSSRPAARARSNSATSLSATAPAPSSKDINLTIEPGEMIGLVGPSGSGKSTLVNLVCRFYDVAEGAILVDGTDIRSFPIEEYRRTSASCCKSRSCFTARSPRTSPTAGPMPTREEIIAAAQAARAHEFILRLPDGYDSLVGERGPIALRRRAAADQHRPGAVDRSAHPDPRRSHLVGRYGDRARDPVGLGQPDSAAARRSPSPTA